MGLAGQFAAVSAFFKANKDMLAFVAGVIGGGLALYRYWRDQQWKKKQLAYDYAQGVLNDPKAMTALRMLDWANGAFPQAIAEEYELAPDQRHWDQDEVAAALRLHDVNPYDQGLGNYSPKEYAIRDLFDHTLAHFERLGHFMRARIIGRRDFPTTLAYYITLLDEPRLEPIRDRLMAYVERYDFDHAAYVIKRLRG